MTHIFNERTEIDGAADIGVDIQTSGGVDKLVVSDQELLADILAELKKVNLHLSCMTDNIFDDVEVE